MCVGGPIVRGVGGFEADSGNLGVSIRVHVMAFPIPACVPMEVQVVGVHPACGSGEVVRCLGTFIFLRGI